jgi:uracil-DNA glycosylase family 4
MSAEPLLLDARAAEALLSFWALAGVDTCYEDATVDRTAKSAIVRAPRPSVTAPRASITNSRGIVAAPIEPTPVASTDAVADARRMAAGARTLEELSTAIAAFDGCPLKTAGARQAVFSRGEADAPVFVIGEAPGADEDIQGEPFVGRAGRLLDRMLRAAGLENRVFVTNTVFWRPPGNRTPTLAEQQVCAPFLERAIDLVGPRVLLIVGGASAKSVLGVGDGILSIRGRWFEWRSRDGAVVIPALPTLHPAFLLRQPAAKKKTWVDMLILSERLDRIEHSA